MSNYSPIRVEELLQLQNIGINAISIRLDTLTMGSDKFICVLQKIDDNAHLVIIDIANPNSPIIQNIIADSVIMNPAATLIAFKVDNKLHIVNRNVDTDITTHKMKQEVTFWKWISSNTVAIITDTTVYHWSAEGDSLPKRMFNISWLLNTCQISNYHIDPTNKWFLLIAIDTEQRGVVGIIQLYSMETRDSLIIEGQAAAFASVKIEDNHLPSIILSVAVRNSTGGKLEIMEVGSPPEGNQAVEKKILGINFPPQAQNDFPISMKISDKYGFIYLITEHGYIHIYDIDSGTYIYTNKISSTTIFVTVMQDSTGDIVGVNHNGQVLRVSVDEENIVPYIIKILQKPDLAFKISVRSNLSAANTLYTFNYLLIQTKYLEAAEFAANAHMGILRTPQTIRRLQEVESKPGVISPSIAYFSELLEQGQLKNFESMELCKLVLQQDGKYLLADWIEEGKIKCTEQLGDLAKSFDRNIAISIYKRANVTHKMLQCFAETGQYENLLLYAKEANCQPDYMKYLRDILRMNPQQAVKFAELLISDENEPLADLQSVFDVFIETNNVQQCSSFFIDALKNDRESEGHLQTHLLESFEPQQADAILRIRLFTHFDKAHIAQLCEQNQLYQRALELYTDIGDIKRVIIHAHAINSDWLVRYIGCLLAEHIMECLKALLQTNVTQNLLVCVRIAIEYHEKLPIEALIHSFESCDCYDGLFDFLAFIVSISQDQHIHFKHIQTACKTGRMKELNRICWESNYYNAECVKSFLKDAQLNDQLPLITVCDRFDFVQDLVHYLYCENRLEYIELYVQEINPTRLPLVVGYLLDVGCDANIIKVLIASVSNQYHADELMQEVEQRHKLELLLPWLEARIESDCTESTIHNALAKIYIDSNNNSERFLRENQYYDSLLVGQYCEGRDPYLACVSYERGRCHRELVDILKSNSFFDKKARYLIERRNLELWAKVLTGEHQYRRQLIDEVIQIASSEARDIEDICIIIEACKTANLFIELLHLLDVIVMGNSVLSNNRNLQNELISAAIKVDRTRVMDYITQLNNYDPAYMANIAIINELYEEAFTIYKKIEANISALSILIEKMQSLDRAFEFAQQCNESDVWIALSKAQLAACLLNEAIDSYIKSEVLLTSSSRNKTTDSSGNNSEAANAASDSYDGNLRNTQVLQLQQQTSTSSDTLLLRCFSKILVDNGQLNRLESVEVSRSLIQQGRRQLFEKWLREDKLEYSEELGDIVKQISPIMSLSIYLRMKVPHKVVQIFAETGLYQKIILYANENNYQPDYISLIRIMVQINPEQAVQFGKLLAENEDCPLADLNSIVDVFMEADRIQQCTSFLLNALKNNRESEGYLQTRLLEINLMFAPQVADAILGTHKFTYFDRERIAQLCEDAGLHQQALDLASLKNDSIDKDTHTTICKENAKEPNLPDCTICYDKEVCIAFSCGHCFCDECAARLSDCPVCRGPVTEKIKLFY